MKLGILAQEPEMGKNIPVEYPPAEHTKSFACESCYRIRQPR
jgi:hypothetical protein